MKKEKATVNMSNWELYCYEGEYSLSGIADRHPTIGINAYVAYTSTLVDHKMEDDVLVYETKNTIYRCPLKYMTPYPYRNIIPECKLKLAKLTEGSDSILAQIVTASAELSLEKDRDDRSGYAYKSKDIDYEKLDFSGDLFLAKIKQLQDVGQKELKEAEEQENARLIGLAKQYENCVYLEVSNISRGDKLAYHLGEFTGVVKPDIHSGMFQDSVLYMKFGSEEANGQDAVDFRYFPKGLDDTMETYSWSDNIKRAVIKNMRDSPIVFNGSKIDPGETKEFKPEGHRQGLISPDCYNGKSIFNK